VLGAIALVAIVVAAISFAVVDVSTSAASGCLDAVGPCTDKQVPPVAVIAAVIGAIALLAAVVPTVTWLVHAFSSQHAAKHTDVDYSRLPTAPVRDDEDEFTVG
jgi:hypothetical protein